MQVNTTDASSLAWLPLELVDLAKSRPAATASKQLRASWLFRKAEVFERLAAAYRDDVAASQAARAESLRAYRIAMALTTELADELDLTDTALDEDSPESEAAEPAVAEGVA